jgi:hypothetical protein
MSVMILVRFEMDWERVGMGAGRYGMGVGTDSPQRQNN